MLDKRKSLAPLIGLLAVVSALAQDATFNVAENLPKPDPAITDCSADHQKRGRPAEEPIDPAAVADLRTALDIDLRATSGGLDKLQALEPLCFYLVSDGRLLMRDGGLEFHFHKVPKWQLERIDIIVSGAQTRADQGQESSYLYRPLRLAQIAFESGCPVSVGSNALVPSSHPYIFGAGGYFFGKGPVYLGFGWKPADRAEARFELVERMPQVPQGYRLKTPLIMDPQYEGEALVRGARIGSDIPAQILFDGPRATGPALVLRSQNPGTFVTPAQLEAGQHWGFWPTSMVVPARGCYALQIDTESGSDIVVFEATQE
jgi:hypothetical protein